MFSDRNNRYVRQYRDGSEGGFSDFSYVFRDRTIQNVQSKFLKTTPNRLLTRVAIKPRPFYARTGLGRIFERFAAESFSEHLSSSAFTLKLIVFFFLLKMYKACVAHAQSDRTALKI